MSVRFFPENELVDDALEMSACEVDRVLSIELVVMLLSKL